MLGKLIPAYIPKEILQKTLAGYETNTFMQNLLNRVPYPFTVNDIENVVGLYHLGTIQKGNYKGAITFPFIDIYNRVQAIQTKQYNNKNHTIGTNWLHSIITKYYKRKNKPCPSWLGAYNKNESKVACLFGEYLLNIYRNNPVALVEAPKTAIYATLYYGFPGNPKNFLWLAVYNKSSLTIEKCKPLENRNVVLFPDLSKDGDTYQLWHARAKEMEKKLQGIRCIVDDLLERLAPEKDRIDGNDIADYLIQLDWREFREQLQGKNSATPTQTTTKPLNIDDLTQLALKEIGENNHIHKNHITYFKEMLEQKIIQRAEPLNEHYYLSWSYPF